MNRVNEAPGAISQLGDSMGGHPGGGSITHTPGGGKGAVIMTLFNSYLLHTSRCHGDTTNKHTQVQERKMKLGDITLPGDTPLPFFTGPPLV